MVPRVVYRSIGHVQGCGGRRCRLGPAQTGKVPGFSWAGFEDEVHRRLGRPANRLYPAFSNQSEREERAPSSRSQEMTFSCLVLSPLAASSGVPCA
jgi:hypothetical protein